MTDTKNEFAAALSSLNDAFNEKDNYKSWEYVAMAIGAHVETIRTALTRCAASPLDDDCPARTPEETPRLTKLLREPSVLEGDEPTAGTEPSNCAIDHGYTDQEKIARDRIRASQTGDRAKALSGIDKLDAMRGGVIPSFILEWYINHSETIRSCLSQPDAQAVDVEPVAWEVNIPGLRRLTYVGPNDEDQAREMLPLYYTASGHLRTKAEPDNERVKDLEAENEEYERLLKKYMTEREQMRAAWKAVGECPEIVISAQGDKAALIWNELCAIIDKCRKEKT